MTPETLINDIPYAAADAYRENRLDDLDFLLTQWSEKAIEKHPFIYGDTVYMRHTYNGLIALDNGQIELAKRELLKAGYSPKSAMLTSFGPNMLLAKRLLEVGEKQTVLKFLKYCKKFWLFPFRLLFGRKWVKSIQDGKVPEFKMHVTIFMDRLPKKENEPV